MVIDMIKSYESYAPVIEKMFWKSRHKSYQVKTATDKINKTFLLVECLLESLYLNPLWMSELNSEIMLISNHPLFVKSKSNVDSLSTASLNDLMKHVTLSEPASEPVLKWSNRYSEIIKGSTAILIVDGWFTNFKQ